MNGFRPILRAKEFNRRSLIFSGGAGVFASLFAKSAFAQTQIDTPTTQKGELPIKNRFDDLLMVNVFVNEQGPYHFVVDTGSEQTILSQELADKLNLKTVGNVKLNGLMRTVSSDIKAVSELSFGPFQRNNLALPVLPYNKLQADGFLGLDSLKNSRVEFDFVTNQMRIEKSHGDLGENYDPGVVIVQAEGRYGRLKMSECYIDGVSAVAFVDSGSQLTVCNLELVQALQKKRKAVLKLGKVEFMGVTGGSAIGDAISISRIELQNLNSSGNTIIAADLPNFSLWRSQERPALLLGMDFLRLFRQVTIDYRLKKIRFDLVGKMPLLQMASLR